MKGRTHAEKLIGRQMREVGVIERLHQVRGATVGEAPNLGNRVTRIAYQYLWLNTRNP